MITLLDLDNIFEYLTPLSCCGSVNSSNSQISLIPAKNFNLRLACIDGKNLLIKQELPDYQGQTNGRFWAAWQINQFTNKFPDFAEVAENFMPKILHFDAENSILIVEFLSDFVDLYQYYLNTQEYSIEISKSIGKLFGNIHSHTFQRKEYQDFFTDLQQSEKFDSAIDIIRRLSRITPQVFQQVPLECLQFFKLYQRFPSLSQAITDLGSSISHSCLVHNDLKLNNLLLDLNWQQPGSPVIRSIDWECANWGDPAFDLGCILGSYLEIWLDGLVIGDSLTINESLQLATTPLEILQPSLFTLVCAYLDSFPEIITVRPDYLDRVIQFAGLSLIQRIEITIDEDRIFGNHGIVMLQVAKQLLCNPQSAMIAIFGDKQSQLIRR